MLKNTHINIEAVKKIAIALKDLNSRVVFVGGTVVSLYIDDPAAEDVRPTKDVDISLEIASLSKLEEIRVELKRNGFIQSPEDTVICRFRFDDVMVDVMATHPIGWAPANEWFEEGFKQLQKYDLNEININIMPFVYFLASKLSAFLDRGIKDPRTSKDFEDIVYLLNYTSGIKEQVINASHDVKAYISSSFKKILESPILQEAILCNLYYEDQIIRSEKINNIMREIVDSI
jgi:predicted nucleotidyltransferase